MNIINFYDVEYPFLFCFVCKLLNYRTMLKYVHVIHVHTYYVVC